eukprot:jgi/Mesvir1/5620/Mv15638-RA.1
MSRHAIDDSVAEIVLNGIQQGWCVSMNEDGDLVFERPDEDFDDDVRSRGTVEAIPVPHIVRALEPDTPPSPPRKLRKRDGPHKVTQHIRLGCGKKLRVSVKVTEDS